MTTYQRYKEAIKATNAARRAATKVLINNHRTEFDLLYVEEATRRGLNPSKTLGHLSREAEAADTVEVQA